MKELPAEREPNSETLARFRSNVREHVLNGRFRPAASSAHSLLVRSELAGARVLDALAPRPPADVSLLSLLTVLVKTFERPTILRRLIAGIKRLYPALKIVVVDDSRTPVYLDGVETITLPYDSGVSAGRAAGLLHITTDYVLVVDDDFVFYRSTRLSPALELMERHCEIDIMGGQMIRLPFFQRAPRSLIGPLWSDEATPPVPVGSYIGGLEVAAKVPNFFIGRRERIALVGWDPEIRRLDHADFFTRALGVLTTVYNPELRCLHATTPFDAPYMEKRLDIRGDLGYLSVRHGVHD